MEKSDESRTRRDEQRGKYSKMVKRAKDAQKDLHSRTGRDEKKGKTQKRMERGSRNRSSSAGSEEMERELVADRKKWKDIVRQAKDHSGL